MTSLLRDGADLAAGLASGSGPSAAAAAVLSSMAAASSSAALGMAAAASAGGDAHFFDDASSPAKIRSFLDSHVESDKLHGMKWLLAMLSKGNSVAEFFPDVVKNVVVKNLEVKKMVYIYLVHYADFNDSCREIALLSINSFQKDLAGANQLIRGLALRVLTSIRVPDIIQIQLLAVRKCATDSSPYVRRCAAVALAKLHVLDASQDEALIELVEKLLADSSTLVLGSAVAALQEIAPNNYELLHGSFRKLCHLLADLDEWTQVSVLNMMQRYVRSQFTDPRRRDGRLKHAPPSVQAQHSALSSVTNSTSVSAPRPGKKPGSTKGVTQKGFYSDDSDSSDDDEGGQFKASIASASASSSAAIVPQQGSVFIGKDVTIEFDSMLESDHRLILASSLALLKSRNSAVVLAVCALHFHCGIIDPQSPTPSRIAKAMVRIMKSRREIQYSVLGNIKLMALETPWMFQPFVQDFFVKSTDPLFNRLLKLDILTAICSKENSTAILKELQAYIKDNNITFIVASINAVAKVLEVNQENLGHGVSGLLDVLICHSDSSVHAACATALRHLLQLGLVTAQTAAQAAAALATRAAESLEGGRRKESDKKSKKHSKRQAPQEMDENAEEASRMRQLYKSYVSIMQQAVRRLFISENKLTNPVARANLIWLAGEYYSEFRDVAKDILRLLAQGFCEEATTTKVQILNLAVKYSIHCVGDEEMESLMTYVLELSRYDVSIEVRDLARLMTAVCGLAAGEDEGGAGAAGQQLRVDADALEDLAGRAAKVLLATKRPPAFVQNSAYSISAAAAWEADGSDTKSLFLMGSISAMTGYTSPGYTVLPPWCETQSDSSVRDQSASTASILASSNASDSKGDTGFSNKFTPVMSALDVSNFYDDDDKEEKAAKRGSGARSRRRGRDSSSCSSSSSASSNDASSDSSSSASSRSSESTSSSDSGSSDSDSASTSSSSSGSESSGSPRSGRRAAVGLAKRQQGSQQSAAVLLAEAAPVDAPAAVQKRGVVQRVGRNRPQGTGTSSQGDISLLDMQFSGEPPALARAASDASFSAGDLLDMGHSSSLTSTTAVANMSSNIQQFGAVSPEPLLYASSPHHMPTAAPVMAPASDTALLAQILDSFPGAAALTEDSNRGPPRSLPHSLGADPASMHGSHAFPPGMASMGPSSPVASPLPAASPAHVTAEVISVPRQIINPDLSSGLSVTIAFRHGVPSSLATRFLPGGEAKRVVIRVENRGKDYPIRRIRLGFPADLRRSAVEDVPALGPGQAASLPAELWLVDFVGKSIRVDVRSDGGSHSGSFPVEAWDVIVPAPQLQRAGGVMSEAEFDAWARRLKGFSECLVPGCKVHSSGSSSSSSSRGGYEGIDSELDGSALVAACVERVLRVVDLGVVRCDTASGLVKLCGATRHKPNTSHNVFVTITKESRPNYVTVQVNCEDAVLTTALADVIKKALAK